MVSPNWVDNNNDGKHDVDGLTIEQWATAKAQAATAQGTYDSSGGRTVVVSPARRIGGRPNNPALTQPATDTVKSAVDKFRGGLVVNDPATWQIADWMYSAGILSANPRSSMRAMEAAVKAYSNAADVAASAYAFGDFSKSIMDFLSYVPGSADAGGGGGSGSSTSKQVQVFTPEQAREKALNAYKAILNRAPSEQEISEFVNGLINSAKNAPTIQRTSGRGGTSVQEVTQGFDEKTWTLGFMAAKIPAEGDLSGSAGVAQDMLATLSQNYGIKLSQSLAYDTVRDLVQGKIDENGVEQVFKEQAKLIFPHLSDKIDAGLNPRKIADPYISNTMNILEKSATEADMFNPYVKEALTYKDANGNYVLPTADEHARMLRGKDEWLNTRNGKETMMSAADNILKQMGFE